MSEDDLTPAEIKALLRDHLEQSLYLAERLVATEPITAVLLHIEHGMMHLEKEMNDEGFS